jgi:hypothetical protein
VRGARESSSATESFALELAGHKLARPSGKVITDHDLLTMIRACSVGRGLSLARLQLDGKTARNNPPGGLRGLLACANKLSTATTTTTFALQMTISTSCTIVSAAPLNSALKAF